MSSQSKELQMLKEAIDAKNTAIAQYEEEIGLLKKRIEKFTVDIDEFKSTNAVLLEAHK